MYVAARLNELSLMTAVNSHTLTHSHTYTHLNAQQTDTHTHVRFPYVLKCVASIVIRRIIIDAQLFLLLLCLGYVSHCGQRIQSENLSLRRCL